MNPPSIAGQVRPTIRRVSTKALVAVNAGISRLARLNETIGPNRIVIGAATRLSSGTLVAPHARFIPSGAHMMRGSKALRPCAIANGHHSKHHT